MKKTLLLLAILLTTMRIGAQTFPFQDTSLSVGERVEDLLSRLTLEEKLSLMQHRNPAIPTLGLPAYSWWNEALHGVGRNGLATVWPMPIALAATFQPWAIRGVFKQVAYEAREKYLEAYYGHTPQSLRDSWLHWRSPTFGSPNLGEQLEIQPAGANDRDSHSSPKLGEVPQGGGGVCPNPNDEPTDYTGISFFTPNINIFRDPRWGRGMETYGEDPFLTARMGLACVEGLQQDELTYGREGLVTAACLKHLAVHSGPEGLRHEFDAQVSNRDLWTTYLPAFEYIIKNSHVQQVMCGYNRLNGEPCCTNNHLLDSILRYEWDYDGLIVTDCWALNDCWERDTVIPRHKTHATAALAAAAAFGGEVDLECGSGLDALRTAVDSGYISEEKINEHVRRILKTRMRLMMPMSKENQAWVPMPNPQDDSPEVIAAASLVLLKNQNDLLPLRKGTKIYLAGPNATDTLMPLGNYNGTPAHTVSIREGLSKLFTLVDKPREAEVIVYAGGLNPQLEGEELPVDMPGFYKGDRTRIELPSAQCKELKKLRRKHKPVVLLLCSGSALALDKTALDCEAIIACWYGGEAMGSAIAKSLAGEYDYFGRLPVTFYKSTRQLPDFADYSMAGRTYRYMDEEALFHFGYGLNYGKYHLEDLTYDVEEHRIKARVVTDRESPAGKMSQIVQVYYEEDDDPQGPRKTLVGVDEGSCGWIDIEIDPFWLRRYNEATGRMEYPKPGTPLRLWVGLSSNTQDCEEIIIVAPGQ